MEIQEQTTILVRIDCVLFLSVFIRVYLWFQAGLVGGGKRDRTADLLHAMQALSQLSYTPTREPAL